jgi:hypothetical protein
LTPRPIDGLALGATTHGNLRFTAPLTGITAAVVGILPVVGGAALAGLAVTFAKLLAQIPALSNGWSSRRQSLRRPPAGLVAARPPRIMRPGPA